MNEQEFDRIGGMIEYGLSLVLSVAGGRGFGAARRENETRTRNETQTHN